MSAIIHSPPFFWLFVVDILNLAQLKSNNNFRLLKSVFYRNDNELTMRVSQYQYNWIIIGRIYAFNNAREIQSREIILFQIFVVTFDCV